jgi:hypothetical protein
MNDTLQALQASDWYPDDSRQVGVDFADPAQVAVYDIKQKSGDAAAAALLDELGVQPGMRMADLGCGTGVLACQPGELKATVDAWLQWMQQERGYSREENVMHVRDEHSTFAWVLEGLIERAGFRMLSARFARGVYATYIVQRPA